MKDGLWPRLPIPLFAALLLALAIPPLAWVAFVTAMRRPMAMGDLWHPVVPGFGLFARSVVPAGVVDGVDALGVWVRFDEPLI